MIKPCKVKEIKGKKYRCFFELTFQVIGGKWKLIILYQLSRAGVLRFGELKRAIPDATERMLTKQLRELEADGLIHREVYREVPPRVEYSLKPLGVSIIPVLLQVREWGVNYEREIGGDNSFCGEEYESPQPPEIAAVYMDAICGK